MLDVVGSAVQTDATTLQFRVQAGRASSQSIFARISATGISSVSLVSLSFFFGDGAHLFVSVSWLLFLA